MFNPSMPAVPQMPRLGTTSLWRVPGGESLMTVDLRPVWGVCVCVGGGGVFRRDLLLAAAAGAAAAPT
jgi:hypothetical protein